MKNKPNSRMGKSQYLTYQHFLKHVRTPSNKSNKPNYRKQSNSKPVFQKMLTQTTSSKCKRTQPLSPTKSRSKSRKSKIQNKVNSEKPCSKSMRKSRKTLQNLVMIQSMNLAPPDCLNQEEFIRNSSQQFSTNNNIDHSIWITDSLVEIFRRTQKILEKYEISIQKMKKEKAQAKQLLLSAKKRIVQLESQLQKKKSCQI